MIRSTKHEDAYMKHEDAYMKHEDAYMHIEHEVKGKHTTLRVH